jgi:RsiW-degrading membrane proteinase PrsW (M82 family)
MNSTQFLYGCVAGLVPPLLWLWFWLKENNLHPEPRVTLMKCFLYGMAGVFVALLFQWLSAPLFAAADNFHRYIVWAAIEEIVKFGVVFFVACGGFSIFGAFSTGKKGEQKTPANNVNKKNKMDEPIDAMIYMITAALGFAALENVLFMLGTVSESNLTSVLVVGDMRFIGAILVHVVSSAMVGFMIAASFYCARYLKVIAVIVGLAMATALHSAFNLSIISSTSVDTLKVFAWVWGAVVILIIIFEEIKGLEIRHDILLQRKN